MVPHAVNRMFRTLVRVKRDIGHWYDSRRLLDEVDGAIAEARRELRGFLHVSLVFTCTEGHVTGNGDQMPWSMVSDVSRTRRMTDGKVAVMGRRTYERLRQHIHFRHAVVLTRGLVSSDRRATMVDMVEDAFQVAASKVANEDEEVFVLGGAGVLSQSVPFADRMYVTLLQAGPVVGDTVMPYDEAVWRPVSTEPCKRVRGDDCDSVFVVQERIGPPPEQVIVDCSGRPSRSEPRFMPHGP